MENTSYSARQIFFTTVKFSLTTLVKMENVICATKFIIKYSFVWENHWAPKFVQSDEVCWFFDNIIVYVTLCIGWELTNQLLCILLSCGKQSGCKPKIAVKTLLKHCEIVCDVRERVNKSPRQLHSFILIVWKCQTCRWDSSYTQNPFVIAFPR